MHKLPSVADPERVGCGMWLIAIFLIYINKMPDIRESPSSTGSDAKIVLNLFRNLANVMIYLRKVQ